MKKEKDNRPPRVGRTPDILRKSGPHRNRKKYHRQSEKKRELPVR